MAGSRSGRQEAGIAQVVNDLSNPRQSSPAFGTTPHLARQKRSAHSPTGSGAPVVPAGNEVVCRNKVSLRDENHLRHTKLRLIRGVGSTGLATVSLSNRRSHRRG